MIQPCKLLLFLLFFVKVDWCLTASATGIPSGHSSELDKMAVKEAKKGKKRAREEFEQYLTNFEEAHTHVPIGNSQRLRWMSLLSQRQKEEAHIRRHKLAAKLLRETPQVANPLNQRAEELGHIPQRIQRKMDFVKTQGTHHAAHAKEQMDILSARQEEHNRIIAHHDAIIRKNSR